MSLLKCHAGVEDADLADRISCNTVLRKSEIQVQRAGRGQAVITKCQSQF